jgi:ABC-type Mn2+/Zn2+ transport system permease subunit
MNALDIFSSDFLPPLIAGIALAAACSLLSVLIVLKKLAFIGQGISHAGFGGVGLAAFLGFSVTGSVATASSTGAFGLESLAHDLIVFAFCLSAGLAIGFLSQRRNVKIDTAIGVLLVAAMAFGILLEQARWPLRGIAWYEALLGGRTLTSANWHAVLFGQILNISIGEMWWALGVSLAVILVLALFSKEIAFYSFDEKVSRAFGVPVGLIHYVVLTMMALLIVFTMKLTGIILVNAFLVIPGATATLVSNRLSRVLGISLIVAESGVIAGYVLTFQMGGQLPVGPVIVILLAMCFAVAWIINRRSSQSG